MKRTSKLVLGSLSGLLLLAAITTLPMEVASAAQEITDDHVTIIYPDLPAEPAPKVSEMRDDNLTVVYLETSADESNETSTATTNYSGNGQAYVTPTLTKSLEPIDGNYREIRMPIQITPNYQITFLLRCITSESGNFRAIKRINSVDLLTVDGVTEKEFNGHIYIHLADPNRLDYIINGDLFNSKTNSQTIPQPSQVLEENSLLTNFSASGINSTDPSHYIFQDGQVNF